MGELKIRTRVDGYFTDEYTVIAKNGIAEFVLATITMVDFLDSSSGWFVCVNGDEVHCETKSEAVRLAIETRLSSVAEFVDDDDLLFRYGKNSWVFSKEDIMILHNERTKHNVGR